MSVNPHLQYLQLLEQFGLSPQMAQLQLQQQQQLQQQRQQLFSQHIQQQQQQQQPQHVPHQMGNLIGSLIGNLIGNPSPSQVNPLLAAINGHQGQSQSQQTQQSMRGATGVPNLPNLLSLPMQSLQTMQNVQNVQNLPPSQTMNMLQSQQQQPQPQQPQMPLIKEVWASNLEHEFLLLRSFTNDKSSTVYIAMHQEIPGIVARPIGTFKSSSDYHFQTLRSNSDLLNLIKLSLCVTKVNGHDFTTSVIWQFNFAYDLSKEMYNEEHLSMLAQGSLVNLQMHMTQGIPHFSFAELMIESGLLLDTSVNWISYHAGYDLGYLVSLLSNDMLPVDEKDFFWWCSKYFPKFYDLKFIGSNINTKSINGNLADNSSEKNGSKNKPSIEYLAEELHLWPISPLVRQYFASASQTPYSAQQNQQMSSSLQAFLSMECFKEILRRSGFDATALDRFKGMIWGLGTVHNPSSADTDFSDLQFNGSLNMPTPSTPGNYVKSGVVHYGRPL